MGYTTDFKGQFDISPALSDAQVKYLQDFSSTRRMKRDNSKLLELYGECTNIMGTYGTEGEFFVPDSGNYGQEDDGSVIEYNYPPKTQPGLWCQWTPTEGGQELIWDGGEKFYDYIEWLEYLIKSFFIPWGVKLNGVVRWQGEEFSDRGQITVQENEVIIQFLE